MRELLPFQLFISWIIFSGFVNTHQRHARSFRGASQNVLLALNISVIVGSLTGLGLLIYYFTQVAWYWPIILVILGSIIGGFLFSYLDSFIGQLWMSLLAFIGWPATALWSFIIISRIGSV